MALNVTLLIIEPSGPVKIDLICFSPTIDDFNIFKSSITNFGSGFPDPNGDRILICDKKFSFKADGEILASKKY